MVIKIHGMFGHSSSLALSVVAFKHIFLFVSHTLMQVALVTRRDHWGHCGTNTPVGRHVYSRDRKAHGDRHRAHRFSFLTSDSLTTGIWVSIFQNIPFGARSQKSSGSHLNYCVNGGPKLYFLKTLSISGKMPLKLPRIKLQTSKKLNSWWRADVICRWMWGALLD